MRKPSPQELQALIVLSKYPSFVPGDAASGIDGQLFIAAIKGLVRKGYVTVEPTDDGPRYSLSAQGMEYASRG